MARGDPSLADIAFGESLVRVGAHLDIAVESYGRAGPGSALVHANRSLELMPRISQELWRHPEVAKSLNHAAAGIASGIRRRRPAAEIVALRDRFDALAAEAVEVVVGRDAETPRYRGSVVVAALRTATAAHDAGVGSDASALVRRARTVASTLWGGAISPEEVDRGFDDLEAGLGRPDPGSVKHAVAEIAAALRSATGATVDFEVTPGAALERVAQLLEQARDAARSGDAFRADKLVGRAYVEGYAPARDVLEGWAEEAELDDLIGKRIRLALARGEPIDDFVAHAVELLRAAPA